MNSIFRHLRFLIAGAYIFTGTLVLMGQSSNTQRLKWQGLGGVDNEFLFLIPEGYQVADDGDFFFGKDRDSIVQVKTKKTVSRYMNGVVLMMDLYQGKIKDIEALLTSMYQSELVKAETVNGFEHKTYVKKFPDFVLEQQYFSNKNTLYILSAAYRSERSDLVKNFFKVVQLVNQGQTVAPNLPKDKKVPGLPDIILETYSGEMVEEPDKKAIVVYRPRPSFKREFGKSNSGAVKLKLLLSADGKVNKVNLLSSPNVSLADGVRASAEHVVFLPALKNGKHVTSWLNIDYGFQMTLTGF
jgi:hypothetical protein